MNNLTYRLLACACLLSSACSDDENVDGAGGNGAGGAGGSTSTAIPGEACGDVTCLVGEYCGFAPGSCDGPQSCLPSPDECPAEVACGCDGENYASPCLALDAVGGTIANEACAPPEGQFACTYEYQVPIYCDLGAEYCHVTPTGDLYELECVALPAACGEMPEDCDCLDDRCSENYCAIDDEDFAITVLCPFN
jgi:hypothetical protein